MATNGHGGASVPDREDPHHHAASLDVMAIAEEKRSKRNPNQLDFEAAMQEFHNMFPGLPDEKIEAVLRANRGSVDETIDQLLSMTSLKEENVLPSSVAAPLLPPKPPGSSRPMVIEVVSRETPPSLPPREGSLKRQQAEKTSPILHNTPNTVYGTDWNGMQIPLLGKLPADFLRLPVEDAPPPRPPKPSPGTKAKPSRQAGPSHIREDEWGAMPSQQKSHPKARLSPGPVQTKERLSTNAIKRQIEANQRRILETCDSSDIDAESARYLEDERLALIMQNEEFLRELKRNEDFMRTLEFERDLLAARLAVEQHKNKQLRSQEHSPVEDRPHRAFMHRASEQDDDFVPHDQPTSSPEANSVLNSASTITSSQVPVDKSDVHDFRDQLRSMGATSKQKFAELAKMFFSTARKARRGNKIARAMHGPSTLNLLEDNDDEDLLDASNSQDVAHDAEALFEPLADNWTSTARGESTEPFNDRLL